MEGSKSVATVIGMAIIIGRISGVAIENEYAAKWKDLRGVHKIKTVYRADPWSKGNLASCLCTCTPGSTIAFAAKENWLGNACENPWCGYNRLGISFLEFVMDTVIGSFNEKLINVALISRKADARREITRVTYCAHTWHKIEKKERKRSPHLMTHISRFFFALKFCFVTTIVNVRLNKSTPHDFSLETYKSWKGFFAPATTDGSTMPRTMNSVA